MAFFDRLFKKKTRIRLEDLMAAEYEMQYYEECRYIWKNYVPERGQAKTLQGELLREIEKLRYEAQNNGNRNWDDDFAYFCDFINESLSQQSFFTDTDRQITQTIMSWFKTCGSYARAFYNYEIPEEKIDPDKIAYVYDNLFDRISDQIGRLQAEHPEPIRYHKNMSIKR